MEKRTPVTVITGFLGSGKTTLVNNLLRQGTGSRIGVIVNEFGDLGIDGALIAQAGGKDVVELASGCVCCASRGDLAGALAALTSSGREFDHILLESSGLADPGPVLEMLHQAPIADQMCLDRAVAVVDAANFDENLEHAEAAYNQIAHADLLVLNKVDLVEQEVVDKIRAGLSMLNSSAEVILAEHASVQWGDVAPGPAGRSPERRVIGPGERGYGHAVHEDSLTSVSIQLAGPVTEPDLLAWARGLSKQVVRIKGIVDVGTPSDSRTVSLHGVSGTVSVSSVVTGDEAGPRGVVVIGADLEEGAIRDNFRTVVSGAALAAG